VLTSVQNAARKLRVRRISSSNCSVRDSQAVCRCVLCCIRRPVNDRTLREDTVRRYREPPESERLPGATEGCRVERLPPQHTTQFVASAPNR